MEDLFESLRVLRDIQKSPERREKEALEELLGDEVLEPILSLLFLPGLKQNHKEELEKMNKIVTFLINRLATSSVVCEANRGTVTQLLKRIMQLKQIYLPPKQW